MKNGSALAILSSGVRPSLKAPSKWPHGSRTRGSTCRAVYYPIELVLYPVSTTRSRIALVKPVNQQGLVGQDPSLLSEWSTPVAS